MKVIGITLMLLGIATTILTGLLLATRGMSNVSPQEITNPNKIPLYWSPVTALILITAGVIILVINTKEKRTVQ
jgi:hypothetical protein